MMIVAFIYKYKILAFLEAYFILWHNYFRVINMGFYYMGVKASGSKRWIDLYFLNLTTIRINENW